MGIEQSYTEITAIGNDARNGGGEFVSFSAGAWQKWDDAIGMFIDDIDANVTAKLAQLRENYKDYVGYPSAGGTKTLLQETAVDEIEQSIKNYRTYLEELRTSIKAAYDRLNATDQNF